jgi:hypothetical protein
MKFQRSYPKYQTVLPSTGEKIYFRPFLVSDEKSLLIIKEEKNSSLIIKNVLELIEKCFDGINKEKITLQDMEYLFCSLRSKSIGEIVKTNFTCPITQEKIRTSLDLSNLFLKEGKTSFELQLDDNLKIKFESPTIVKILLIDGKFDMDHFIKCSISQIQKEHSIYNFEDLSSSDIEEIFSLFTKKEYNEIKKFINDLPKVCADVKYITADGVERTLRLDGVLNFFTLI